MAFIRWQRSAAGLWGKAPEEWRMGGEDETLVLLNPIPSYLFYNFYAYNSLLENNLKY